jgi:iron(III) transport system permease protein
MVLALGLGIPLFSIGWWLLHGNSSTLPHAPLTGALAGTAGYSAAAAALAVLLAIPLAAFSLKSRRFWGRTAERLAFLPQAIPGVVVGLALVFFALHGASPLYQSPVLLVIAYANLFLPLALVPVRSVLASSSASLAEAARSLGAGPAMVFFRVQLPLMLPGLAGAFALVFLSASTELTATLLLRPTGLETLSTQFWNYVSEVSYGAAAPDAILLVLLSLGPGILLARSARSRGAVE